MARSRIAIICFLIVSVFPCGCRDRTRSQSQNIGSEQTMNDKPNKKDQTNLTPLQFHVTQEKGTEAPFSGKYYNHFAKGGYQCVVCGNKLFDSKAKFESSCGWPSFSEPAKKTTVSESNDNSHDMIRTEISCEKCGAHLGHVFIDSPPPSGLRYCINSASLKFVEADRAED